MTNKNYQGKSLLALLLVLLACPENVQSKSFEVPQNNDIEITLDGKLDEPFWREAKKLSLDYEVQPAENSVPEVSTDVYIIQDDDYLYLGFDAKDKDLAAIQASYQDRDNLDNEDYVGFVLDTFNDQRRAYKFQVNPLGIQADSIQDEVLDTEDSSWNAIWSSAGSIQSDGYMVEIKIPYSVLRFSNDNQQKQWAMNFVRNYPRNYKYQYSYSKHDRNNSCSLCQLETATGFSNIDSGNNLELTPFVTSQRNDLRARDDDWSNGGFDNEVGLDGRWGVTDNSVMNLTINPDFSQVESDTVQFDVNNQFALYYDEKRPFFLEGDDFFTTQLTTYYSRNIADPNYGIKYTGKEGDGSVGFMYVRDQLTNLIVPGTYNSSLQSLVENPQDPQNSEFLESDAMAFRYAYDLSSDTVLGSSLTHRSGGDYSNTLVNFDGKHQLTDSDVLRYQVIYTETQDQGDTDKKQGNAYRINYKHDGRDWSWFLSHNIFDQDFRADLGFLTRVGYRKSVIGGYRRWYGEKDDFWSRIQIGGDWDISYDQAGKKIEEESESRMSFIGKYQSSLNLLIGTRNKFHVDSVNSIEAWYKQNYWSLNYEIRPWNTFTLGFISGDSDSIDFRTSRAGTTKDFALYFDWQLGLHLNFEMSVERQEFELIKSINNPKDKFYKADAINAKLVYQFNEKSYLRVLLRSQQVVFDPQYFEVRTEEYSKNISRQLLFAYKLDAKSVVYVGYSDGAHAETLNRTTERDSRDLFVKFSYAFQL